jgi:hypothetical protein
MTKGYAGCIRSSYGIVAYGLRKAKTGLAVAYSNRVGDYTHPHGHPRKV